MSSSLKRVDGLSHSRLGHCGAVPAAGSFAVQGCARPSSYHGSSKRALQKPLNPKGKPLVLFSGQNTRSSSSVSARNPQEGRFGIPASFPRTRRVQRSRVKGF